MFPEIAFDEDVGMSGLWRGVFEEWLCRAGEPPLGGETTRERYRFQTSAGGPGALLRIEAGDREAVVKQFESAPAGWTVREFRRTLTGRELDRLRGLIETAGFWTMPSPNPASSLGLDGARYLFEATAAGRYHLVQRWSPHRSDFARLCRWCESLSRHAAEPRRAWWRFGA